MGCREKSENMEEKKQKNRSEVFVIECEKEKDKKMEKRSSSAYFEEKGE